MDIPPNQTIYINNLNEKMKKEGTNSYGIFPFSVSSSSMSDFLAYFYQEICKRHILSYTSKFIIKTSLKPLLSNMELENILIASLLLPKCAFHHLLDMIYILTMI